MSTIIRRFLSRVSSPMPSALLPEPNPPSASPSSPASTPSTERYLGSEINRLKRRIVELEQIIASQTGDSKLAEKFVELEADANRWRKVAQEANAHAWDDYGRARTKAILQELVDNL